jgi:hypothetical protein
MNASIGNLVHSFAAAWMMVFEACFSRQREEVSSIRRREGDIVLEKLSDLLLMGGLKEKKCYEERVVVIIISDKIYSSN